MAKGKLIIITAPSGAGKTTLVSALVNNDDNLRVSVSYTTRPERLGEENGINYHFVDEKESSQNINEKLQDQIMQCLVGIEPGFGRKID